MTGNGVDWIALGLITAECPRIIPRLLSFFPDPADALRSTPEEFGRLGLAESQFKDILSGALLERADEETGLLRSMGGRAVGLGEPDYPALLKHIPDPPLALYCLGDPGAWNEPVVGIVGARKPSPYGRAVAENLARELAGRGLVVASGLAEGIDTRAHVGAMETGRTIAVLGTGLDTCYPRQNRRLAEKIAATGALITEFPFGSEPRGKHFPQRNRLISGLSLALVVVEASLKSGSLITAGLALEQNREVLAVPGAITSTLSSGTNALIQAGAKPVTRWQDVVEELPGSLRNMALESERCGPAEAAPRSGEEKRVWGCLGAGGPVHIDELASRADVPLPDLLAVLLDMELRGLVRQSPGKYYTRSL
ncbi:MAG: DNA protecting protein DprA [Candidatus Aminicenantes bacterium RBG_13_62_12]|nr:MAG: DNA protecting protein DprA [Candidatus Aminicenantes bacterium RBG_13_62_12]